MCKKPGIKIFIIFDLQKKSIFLLFMNRVLVALRVMIVVCCFLATTTGLQAVTEESPATVSDLLRQAKLNFPNDLDVADSLAQKALLTAISLDNDSLIAQSNFALGLIQYYKGNIYCSSYHYERALETDYAERQTRFAENSWNNLGINYQLLSRYADAAESYYNSLRMARQRADSLSIYQTYINLGHLHDLLGQGNESRRFLQEALEYFTHHNDQYHIALCYHNMGISEGLGGDADAGIRFLRKAVTIFSEMESNLDLLKCYYDLGYLYLREQNYDQAQLVIDSAIQLSHDVEDPFWQASGWILKTEYAIQKGDYGLAEQNIQRTEGLITLLESDSKLKSFYTAKVKLYSKTGQLEKLNNSLAQLDSITDSLIAKRADANIAQFRAMYEFDKTRQELESINTELIFNRKILRNRSIFALVTFVLSVVVLTMYLNLRNKKHALFQRNLELVTERKHHNNLLVGASVSMEVIPDNNGNGTETENGKFLKLYHQVRTHIIQTKSYLKPDLNITDLAFALHTNEKYISRAIAAGSGTNFSTFINTFRVNEAKSLLSDPANNQLTGDQVADKCGFSNSHTCRRNFRKITGLNPLEFRNMSQREID